VEVAAIDETVQRPVFTPVIPLVEVDEAAARRTLRDQVAKLEAELSASFVAAYPRKGIEFQVNGRGGPRMLSLGDLERLRDDLAHRVQEARRTLDDRAEVEGRYRLLIEEMLRNPARYKWVRVSNEDIGEPGCRHWHVRPRLGPIGMLMGWWRVKISSGCPLATAGPPVGSADRGTSQPQAPCLRRGAHRRLLRRHRA
jgi:hypothetical protein